MTKLASKLPKGDGNGLEKIAEALVDQPDVIHAAIVLVDCSKVTLDTDSGDQEPTARIRRIEVIDDADKAVVAQMLRRAFERRTGKTVLPLELEDDIVAVFGDMEQDGDR